ncbi:MAG: transcriptional regulator [Gammaproteobacteria bacterium]|nr:MAG: transcriptional regulator [Gammaproteobacteria bacterium]
MTNTVSLLEDLLQSLKPIHLTIQDDSHLHAGHAGNTGGGHFTLLIVSDDFTGLSLIKRHRLVFDTVGDLMKTHIHALSIQAKTPAEFSA